MGGPACRSPFLSSKITRRRHPRLAVFSLTICWSDGPVVRRVRLFPELAALPDFLLASCLKAMAALGGARPARAPPAVGRAEPPDSSPVEVEEVGQNVEFGHGQPMMKSSGLLG